MKIKPFIGKKIHGVKVKIFHFLLPLLHIAELRKYPPFLAGGWASIIQSTECPATSSSILYSDSGAFNYRLTHHDFIIQFYSVIHYLHSINLQFYHH